ncbi:MoaD/ThiS family protein [Nocardioides jensenii]|uniref:MoaD/ThiS family protein n=1 Tax=Nocardioides jensenii TaxID=1843 RepID=UPI00082D08F2|nr:MoaD/ThiS family protein [Nocardioides jensenii]
MAPDSAPASQRETQIIVRYWASARAAAGVNEDVLDVDEPLTLTEIRARALALHPDAPTLERVIGACSVLVDDEPAGRRDPDTVRVRPGQSVEFLPPFAGG